MQAIRGVVGTDGARQWNWADHDDNSLNAAGTSSQVHPFVYFAQSSMSASL